MKRSIFTAAVIFAVSIGFAGCGSSSSSNDRGVNSVNKHMGVKLNYPKLSKTIRNDGGSFPSNDELKRSVQDRYASKQMSIKEVILTPYKGGMFVYATGGGSMTLDLYGLENPNDPHYEGSIYSDVDIYASNIKMLGHGVIQYDLKDIYSHGAKTRIKYNYFEGKVISRERVGGGNGDGGNSFPSIDELKNSVRESRYDRLMKNVYNVVLTPQKGGMVVYAKGTGGTFLDLFGLEDPHHPKFEGSIFNGADYSISNIKMLGNGLVQYDLSSDTNRDYKYRIKYNYFRGEEVSSKHIGGGDNGGGNVSVKDRIIKIAKNGNSHASIGIKYINHIEGNYYLVKYSFYPGGGDEHLYIAIFDLNKNKKVHTLSNQNLDGGSGTNEAQNISKHTDTNTITYTRTLNSFEYAEHPKVRHFTYNYKTGKEEHYDTDIKGGGSGNDTVNDRDSLTPEIVKNMINRSYGDRQLRVSKLVLSPSKYGAVVYSRGPGAMYLDLYGLDDINHPNKEYSIYASDDDDHIENIKMLGNGVVEFEIRTMYSHHHGKKVKYDYFHHKEISSQDFIW
jgi:hypothetical protein